MDILLIAEELITPFKFWHSGRIVTGMHFRNDFYGQMIVSPHLDRERFFQQIERLSVHSSGIVITASKQRYIAWLNLRTLSSTRQFSQASFPNGYLLAGKNSQAMSSSILY